MNLLVCYGGTFDPVHLGHLAIARGVRAALDAEVALLPAADPPHKASTQAPAAERVTMLTLALEAEPGLALDTRELARSGPSYTVDTLRELRAEAGPLRPIAWLLGSDSLHALARWHRWRALFEYAHVLAVERPRSAVDADSLRRQAPVVHAEVTARQRPARDLVRTPAGGFAVLRLRVLREESSTAVRTLAAAGGEWQRLVPAAVARYIQEAGLYGLRPPTAPPL